MSSKIFNINPKPRIQRSTFDLSHEFKFAGKMGQLMPVLCQEVVPGDKFEIDTESMIRFAPMVAPLMHRINSYIHYFYVPNRIIWDQWEKFITGAEISLPTIPFDGGVYQGSIADLLGLPPKTSATAAESILINDLPLRAFYQIYKDYYVDQNLSLTDGQKIVDLTYEQFISVDDVTRFFTANTFLRSWEKDYFTSALPWAQKGEPVSMHGQISSPATQKVKGNNLSAANVFIDSNDILKAQETGNLLGIDTTNWQTETLVSEMRTAEKLQKFLERMARSGSRYVEHLLGVWGVRSSDQRLQRAEYIGGGKSPVVVSEVLNTTGTTELPQGNMAGHGINVGRTNHASKYVEEHGFIIGIMSVMPEPNYGQGIQRLWNRKINLDFFYPDFAQLGEQPVLNQELFYNHENAAANAATFGYQSIWAEYKYQPSRIAGHFRDSLDFWTAFRKFETAPALNQEFIECDTTDINERIFAVTDPLKENLYVQLYHRITATRPLPFFNVPSI